MTICLINESSLSKKLYIRFDQNITDEKYNGNESYTLNVETTYCFYSTNKLTLLAMFMWDF